ncbi:ABC transporter ATP-binding protein [Sanguibacter sp. HDW7]|uniref:ABC transporter ATP-binding protein n=1 Tax=Sanguibacter sp. HDW7 TaxID=2714931 RepID=UPI001F0CFC2A|nr:ABC transporter ATP-binding protein [Sanguibacter sp. HDW7]
MPHLRSRAPAPARPSGTGPAAPSPAPRLACTGIDATYDGRTPVLHDVAVTFAPGRLTAIVGPNGSGKSTLLACLAHQLHHDGSVTLDGTDVARVPRRRLARRLAFLPQSPTAPEGVSVRGLTERGRTPHRRAFAPLGASDHAAVGSALARLDLEPLAERRLTELSGGQRQRAWIALVLAQDAPTLLLDEPTAFLDLAQQASLLDLARTLAHEGRTVLAVLHDLNLAAAFADELVVLDRGRVHAQGAPADVLTRELLAEVFGLRADLLPDPMTGAPVILPRPSVPLVALAAHAARSVAAESVAAEA